MLGIQMDVMKCDLKTAKKNAGDWGDSDQLKNLDADLHNFMIIYRDGKPEEIRHQLREILDSAGKYLKHEKKKNRTANEEKLHKVASKLCEILPEHIIYNDSPYSLSANSSLSDSGKVNKYSFKSFSSLKSCSFEYLVAIRILFINSFNL